MFALKIIRIHPHLGVNSFLNNMNCILSTFVKSRQPTLMTFPSRFKYSKGGDGTVISQGAQVKLAYQKYQLPFQPDDTVPIIILHGLLGSKSNWHSLAKSIHEGTYNRKVITLDARNHGDSPHIPDFSYEDMVCDLVKFLDDHNITKASFIGHSMGGRVCMLFSLLYPKMVHSLVIVDISPINENRSILALNGILKALVDLNIDPSTPLRQARKQAFSQLRATIKDDNLINFLVTNMVEKRNSSQWRWKINSKAIYKNFSSICNFPLPYREFAGRTLFVVGRLSDYVMPTDEERIKQVFVNAEFTYIEGAGHWVHADKPKEFLTIVVNFLNGDGRVTD